MKRSFPREFLLLSAPLLLLAGVAFWATRRPKPIIPVPKKWRIESELIRSAPLPVDVRKGVDTQFEMRFHVLSPKDKSPTTQGSFWNDIRLVETDEHGRDARVWDFERRFYAFPPDDWKHIDRLFFGGAGSGGDGWNMNYRFALRRISHPTRHLELRVDSVWRPVTTQMMIMDATPGQIAQMRIMSDALSTSRRWVLRTAGETTPTLHVSTDPLFDIRRVELRSIGKSDSSILVIWHVFWRGPLKPKQFSVARLLWGGNPSELSVYDERNKLLTKDYNVLRDDWKSGRSFPVFHDLDLSELRRQAKLYDSKTLFLRGWISVNQRWPREVNLKLPNWILYK
ncbi:hypothetical protein IAD21_03600 [Abditibacteriota bacterium]|nr:hypothetical protein IAD21_03600 [Abditibacteriota bacterium]